eukprot:g10901.t1
MMLSVFSMGNVAAGSSTAATRSDTRKTTSLATEEDTYGSCAEIPMAIPTAADIKHHARMRAQLQVFGSLEHTYDKFWDVFRVTNFMCQPLTIKSIPKAIDLLKDFFAVLDHVDESIATLCVEAHEFKKRKAAYLQDGVARSGVDSQASESDSDGELEHIPCSSEGCGLVFREFAKEERRAVEHTAASVRMLPGGTDARGGGDWGLADVEALAAQALAARSVLEERFVFGEDEANKESKAGIAQRSVLTRLLTGVSGVRGDLADADSVGDFLDTQHDGLRNTRDEKDRAMRSEAHHIYGGRFYTFVSQFFRVVPFLTTFLPPTAAGSGAAKSNKSKKNKNETAKMKRALHLVEVVASREVLSLLQSQALLASALVGVLMDFARRLARAPRADRKACRAPTEAHVEIEEGGNLLRVANRFRPALETQAQTALMRQWFYEESSKSASDANNGKTHSGMRWWQKMFQTDTATGPVDPDAERYNARDTLDETAFEEFLKLDKLLAPAIGFPSVTTENRKKGSSPQMLRNIATQIEELRGLLFAGGTGSAAAAFFYSEIGATARRKCEPHPFIGSGSSLHFDETEKRQVQAAFREAFPPPPPKHKACPAEQKELKKAEKALTARHAKNIAIASGIINAKKPGVAYCRKEHACCRAVVITHTFDPFAFLTPQGALARAEEIQDQARSEKEVHTARVIAARSKKKRGTKKGSLWPMPPGL